MSKGFSWQNHLQTNLGNPVLVREGQSDDEWSCTIRQNLGKVPANYRSMFQRPGDSDWIWSCSDYTTWYRKGSWWVGMGERGNKTIRVVYCSSNGKHYTIAAAITGDKGRLVGWGGTAKTSEVRQLVSAIGDEKGLPLCIGWGWSDAIIEARLADQKEAV